MKARSINASCRAQDEVVLAALTKQHLGLLALSVIELQLPVNPVDPLVVPLQAPDVAQIQEAQTKAPIAVVVRQA